MSNNQLIDVNWILESDQYPFTMGQVRHMLLMRHRNGLQVAVRKIGKRLYLRRDLFDQWIESKGSQGENACQ